MFTDLTGQELEDYRSAQVEPEDFDGFWQRTLDEARQHPLALELTAIEHPLRALEVYDLRFSGYGGDRIAAWLRLPAEVDGPLPAIVEFVGYGGGRGLAVDSLFWASCGFAHVQMDTRGQGASWSVGVTPDLGSAGPRVPGMMTAGIEHPERYYYRRLITDAVRCLEAAGEVAAIDAARIAAYGISQGGGVALAATALSAIPRVLVAHVPFLCDFPRAVVITDADPYREVGRFLATHRDMAGPALHTLSYFDGVNFARRGDATAYFTAALMDQICPPSTVFGAYQAYRGPKQIHVWDYNGHESGETFDALRMADVLARAL